MCRVPIALPAGHRRDDARPAVAGEVGWRVPAVELARVRKRREHERDPELLSDIDARIQILASDVVDEVAVLGVALEELAAHEVDQRRGVRGHPEKSAARLHLHDLDALIHEDPMIVVHDRREGRAAVRRLLAIARPRAHDTHVVTPTGEPRRELVREAL